MTKRNRIYVMGAKMMTTLKQQVKNAFLVTASENKENYCADIQCGAEIT